MRTPRPIALAALLLASPLAAELPAPDHVLFGTATRDGLLVESGVVEVRLGTAPEPITTYPIGTVLAYGERFVLRLPMGVREPRRPGTLVRRRKSISTPRSTTIRSSGSSTRIRRPSAGRPTPA